jgi:hypothetical protein
MGSRSGRDDSIEDSALTSSQVDEVDPVTIGKISTRRVTFEEFQSVRVEHGDVLPTTAAAPKDLAVGERLVEMGLLSPADLDDALATADTMHRPLTEVLLQNERIEEQVLLAYASLLKLPALTMAKAKQMPVPKAAIDTVTAELSRALSIVPLAMKDSSRVLIASLTLPNQPTVDALRLKTGLSAVAILTGPNAMRAAQNRFFDGIDEDDPSTWLERG